MKTFKLNYAAGYIFLQEPVNFWIGKKRYQFIKIINDTNVMYGWNTLVVAYDYKNQKYVVFNASAKDGEKTITIE